MVAHILIRMKDNGNRLMLTLERCLGGNIDMEVFLDNVAFSLDIQDFDKWWFVGSISVPRL